MTKVVSILLAAALAIGLASSASAADGERLFKSKCKMCHSLEEGKNKVGPSLYGLSEREAGMAPEYRGYSEALKNSGIVWTEETLDTWLQGSFFQIPGTKMRTRGIKKEEDRKALIEYILELRDGNDR